MDAVEKAWGFSREEHRRRVMEGRAKSQKLAAYTERQKAQGEAMRARKAERNLKRVLGARPSAWERICAQQNANPLDSKNNNRALTADG